jgi:AcrR family transcriptional regulator
VAGRRKLHTAEDRGFAKSPVDLAKVEGIGNAGIRAAEGVSDSSAQLCNDTTEASGTTEKGFVKAQATVEAGTGSHSDASRTAASDVQRRETASQQAATAGSSKHSTKSERTKQALADALEQLMHEMPLAKVTVRGVTQRAGVDRQTFYYHFDTMDDLLEYLCSKRLPMLTGNTLASALENENPRELFVRVVRQVDSQRTVLVPLLNNSGRKLLRGVFYETLHAALVSHMRAKVDEAGVFVSAGAIESAALYCQYASVFIVMDWLCGDSVTDPTLKPETIADMLAQQLDLHAKGLIANAQ